MIYNLILYVGKDNYILTYNSKKEVYKKYKEFRKKMKSGEAPHTERIAIIRVDQDSQKAYKNGSYQTVDFISSKIIDNYDREDAEIYVGGMDLLKDVAIVISIIAAFVLISWLY